MDIYSFIIFLLLYFCSFDGLSFYLPLFFMSFTFLHNRTLFPCKIFFKYFFEGFILKDFFFYFIFFQLLFLALNFYSNFLLFLFLKFIFSLMIRFCHSQQEGGVGMTALGGGRTVQGDDGERLSTPWAALQSSSGLTEMAPHCSVTDFCLASEHPSIF